MGDDVRKYVVRRPLPQKEGKPVQTKAPKIQRLVTPGRLQRKRHRLSVKRARSEAALNAESEYKKLLAKRLKDMKEKKAEAARSDVFQVCASLNLPLLQENKYKLYATIVLFI